MYEFTVMLFSLNLRVTGGLDSGLEQFARKMCPESKTSRPTLILGDDSGNSAKEINIKRELL